jgi:integrase
MIEARLVLGNSALPEEQANPTTPTLDQYYKTFEKTYMETVRFSTRSSYERNFRIPVLPELGRFRLDEINKQKIQEFISTLMAKKLIRVKRVNGQKQTQVVERKLAKDSIRLALAPLSVLFSHASENGIVQHNPISRPGKFYRQTEKVHDEIQPLTAEEVPLFLEGVMAHSPEYFTLFLCAIHTGMRSGEIAGLQWGDIDFNGKFAMVRRSANGSRITLTKTGKVRRVDLSDDLLSCLQSLRRRRQQEYLSEGKNEIPDWVFCNGKGKLTDMPSIKTRYFFKRSRKQSSGASAFMIFSPHIRFTVDSEWRIPGLRQGPAGALKHQDDRRRLRPPGARSEQASGEPAPKPKAEGRGYGGQVNFFACDTQPRRNYERLNEMSNPRASVSYLKY